MLKVISTVVVILTFNPYSSDAITMNRFSARQIGQSVALCISENLIIDCLGNKLHEAIDIAIANNETWQLADYFIIEKNTQANMTRYQDTQRRSLSDLLALKLLELAQTRSIRIQLPPIFSQNFEQQRGFASALNDSEDNGTNGDGSSDDDSREQLEQEEGRKKKDKDKNMAMIGGMAMLAMVAQMFLGKVILVAGAAFVMAKVALLISVLGSLKKGSAIGSGASADHVIVTGGGGGHSHEYTSSGWHRSMPYSYNKLETATAGEPKYTEPVTAYEQQQ